MNNNMQGKLCSIPCKAKAKRRYCKMEGCERIVKSQGLCQRHGAKPCKCKVEGCDKQAQGNFSGMCKSHFREYHGLNAALPRPNKTVSQESVPLVYSHENTVTSKPVAPLFNYLKAGLEAQKGFGWHRSEERATRALCPAYVNQEWEEWEMDLIAIEILSLEDCPKAYIYLAYAWGKQEETFLDATKLHGNKEYSTDAHFKPKVQAAELTDSSSYCVRTTAKEYSMSHDDLIIAIVKNLVDPPHAMASSEQGSFCTDSHYNSAYERSAADLLIASLFGNKR
eukprot:scaffold1748_cov164-Amphora_coffeaeformis.AAC.5